MDILSKIINYENKIFDEYCCKRNQLISHVKNMDLKSLSSSELNIFIHDIKSIIEPVKTSISEIDYYFTNTDFKKSESIEHFKQIKFLYLLLFRLYSTSESSSETEISESSESESSDSSEPESSDSSELVYSESNSSRSVSLTFSNTLSDE